MTETTSLLLTCEQTGAAPPYNEVFNSIVDLPTEAHEIYIISDLHIGAGLGPNATYSGTENFYADAAFHRFLHYAMNSDRSKKNLLIINGDFIDFLRITTIPTTSNEFQEWHTALEQIGIAPAGGISTLRNSISDEVKKGFGLKTNDYKSVWKLLVCAYGHAGIFDALAQWLADGNELVITKGNHDLEWYWHAMRNYFRLIIAEHIARSSNKPTLVILKEILPNIRFIENALVVDGELYIEHGQRYDNFTKVVPEDKQTFNNGQELNIPFGSFFNRYLLNKVELRYPYFENVRPRVSILPLLIKEDFPLAMRVFLRYIPALLRSFLKKRYWPMIFQTFYVFFSIGVPVIAVLVFCLVKFQILDSSFIFNLVSSPPPIHGIVEFLKHTVLTLASGFAMLVISYFLTRLLSFFQLVEPSSLAADAKQIAADKMQAYPNLKIITMGHTHDPEQNLLADHIWYYNTGTWIPVIESSSASVREDKTYTFLKARRESGHITTEPLMRWNDEASRADELVLVVGSDEVAPSNVPSRIQQFKERARWFFAKK
ncbi:MAG TPA: hypothetical protein VEW28_05320 [Candidatus Kapabacteria bacterium]|nr:hypothetical protein [Candidatus Kapabacteria bacterium]